MATTMQFNTTNTRRVPITRNNLFYDRESLRYELEIAKDYVFTDMHQSIVLYQVDTDKTTQSSIYGEADASNIAYKTPVEVSCIYNIDKPELKSYDKTKNLGTYQKTGNLTITVCKDTLDELGVTIKCGDYVGVQVTPEQMVFWTVNQYANNYDNEHSIYGTVNVWYTIICTPTDTSEFTAPSV